MEQIIGIEFQGDIWPWSLAVMLSTRCKWSHVVLHTNKGTIIDASPMFGVKERFPTNSKTRWSKIFDLTTIMPEADRHEAYMAAMRWEGSSYDWGWIFGYPFNQRDWECPDCWVCFEYSYFVLRPFIGKVKHASRIVGDDLEKALIRLEAETVEEVDNIIWLGT